MDVMALKLEALEHRQDLDHLLDLYGQFQRYVELLTPVVRGEKPSTELSAVHRRLQLALHDEEGRFLEWTEGNQVLNPDVYGLVDDPDDSVRDRGTFAHAVAGATTKFEHLIREAERSLRHLHEKIALIEGEAQAQQVTTMESRSELEERLSKLDTAAEAGLKWGMRIYQFGSWAVGIAKSLGL